MIGGDCAAVGACVPGRTTTPVMRKASDVAATPLICPGAATKLPADQTFAVGAVKVVPAAIANVKFIPMLLSISHVPVVSPGMVTVLYCGTLPVTLSLI